MTPLGVLLRCLLILTFCLEGSLSLRGSSAMALEASTRLAEPARAAAVDQDCEDDAWPVDTDGNRRHCECVADCSCVCVFPVVAIAHVTPFAAAQMLASQPIVFSRDSVALAATARIFRPPIG